MTTKVLILGCNGFIGSNLIKAMLQNMEWEIYGIDLAESNLKPFLHHSNFHFLSGDIIQRSDWVESHIQKCDTILPLVAIANPATYVKDPLRVFELDFEANLPIVRWCVKYKKRIIFPSTSEVYGMCSDAEFDEEISNFVLGPTQKERWIYSCSKQLMDRVIYAYGHHQDLQFTLFRPFNWVGPGQDDIYAKTDGSSRVLSQFIGNIIHGREIKLVDGGLQRRCFTYIDDGISALIKIIKNDNGCANGKIFNIGNPANNFSIAELADILIQQMLIHPKTADYAQNAKIIKTNSQDYYGNGYQDVNSRIPSIKNAKNYLDWEPKIDLATAINKTLKHYFDN